MDDILPTEDDYTTILSNFAVLVCRVICEKDGIKFMHDCELGSSGNYNEK